MNKKIKNVIFDFGQVLVRFESEYMVGRYAPPGEDNLLLQKVVFDRLYWDRLDAGTIEDEDALALMCARLPERLHAVAREIYYNWIYNIPVIEGMDELLDCLKAKYKVSLFLLSNISKYFATHSNEIEILKKMDGCVFSGVLGLEKPNAEIYKQLCDRFDLSAEECVFIDDRTENVESAKKLGMHGYLFNGDVRALKEYLEKILS